ncbi:peptidase S10 [Lactococcus petauri]
MDELLLKNPAENANIVRTEHSLTINCKSLDYAAEVGYLPVLNEDNVKTAEFFFVAYKSQSAKDNNPRPVSFIIDGGPGASALMLHMNFFGPKQVAGSEHGIELPEIPYQLIDNDYTLLSHSDLVFVDPIGTGYSRATTGIDPYKNFWGAKPDIESLCYFIRSYLTQNNLFASPIYLIGQSYGGFRCGALAASLQDRGIQPKGIVLISPALSYEDLAALIPNDRPHVHNLPTMSNVAWYHKKLSPEYLSMGREVLYQKAKSWAEKEYLIALWKGNLLNYSEKLHIAEVYSSFSGLEVQEILQYNLRIPIDYFASNLLRDKSVFLGAYDGRITTSGAVYDLSEDPSMFYAQIPAFSALLYHFSRNLNFMESREYIYHNKLLYPAWDFTSGVCNPGNRGGGFACTVGDLSKGLRRNPKVKLFVAMGNYDLRCSRSSFEYSINHLDIPNAQRAGITLKHYDGGHMLYTNPIVKEQFKMDLDFFYEE